jgi:hyperosmotically inducible periplasmic protein
MRRDRRLVPRRQSKRYLQPERRMTMKANVDLRAATVGWAALAAVIANPQAALAFDRTEWTVAPLGSERITDRETEARLNKPQFNDVRVTVEHGIATLTGTVDLYQYKADAERRVHKAKGIRATRNLIEVKHKEISDRNLQGELADRLAYDRVGFGNMFNAIGVKVDQGVATLDGHARTYVDRASALAIVSTTPGVRDVVDLIEVDPVSPMDDETRIRVARAVYGDSSLRKYMIDPVKPIRISVQKGNVSLYGIVNNRMEAQIALVRANGVPGIFSVNSYLRVAGESAELAEKN